MEAHENDLRSVVASEAQCRAVQEVHASAGLTPREIALLDFAVKLTTSPREVRHGDLESLAAHGLDDEQLVDAVHCIGYFNFINRVLDGLGVDAEPAMRFGQTSANEPQHGSLDVPRRET